MRNALWPALLLVAFVTLPSCAPHTVPVYQVSAARLSPYSGRALSPDEVRQLVLRALIARAWSIEREQPGLVFARITEKKHYGVVRVDYNGLGYSISYVETSPSLRYDGTRVHRRYNGWVEKLDAAIQHEFELYEHLPTSGQLAPVTMPVAPGAVPAATPAPGPAPAPVPAPAPAPATPSSGLAPSAPPPH